MLEAGADCNFTIVDPEVQLSTKTTNGKGWGGEGLSLLVGHICMIVSVS
jgi:hypothetical protein